MLIFNILIFYTASYVRVFIYPRSISRDSTISLTTYNVTVIYISVQILYYIFCLKIKKARAVL